MNQYLFLYPRWDGQLVHCVGCYIWYSEEGTGQGRGLPRSLLAVPNVTAHPSTASVLPCNGPLRVVIKELMLLVDEHGYEQSYRSKDRRLKVSLSRRLSPG